jgi:hypothetical protein
MRKIFRGQPESTSVHRRPESPKRGLMSGETLRASRQQLRLLCAPDFHFFRVIPSFPIPEIPCLEPNR